MDRHGWWQAGQPTTHRPKQGRRAFRERRPAPVREDPGQDQLPGVCYANVCYGKGRPPSAAPECPGDGCVPASRDHTQARLNLGRGGLHRAVESGNSDVQRTGQVRGRVPRGSGERRCARHHERRRSQGGGGGYGDTPDGTAAPHQGVPGRGSAVGDARVCQRIGCRAREGEQGHRPHHQSDGGAHAERGGAGEWVRFASGPDR
mmetsp:Transcript_3785/g.8314  ORF Transcript_3785/g.8314 Transcript_3785/m.8314 type:complete len:204 (+) Transcript_3785:644-1255(+)